MRDPITDAAQDPSCLLCLTPDRGGSWWSRLRPPTPRNFADNPMAWTDAKTALDVTDQSHDFTFEIEFKCVKTNAVYIFAPDGSNDFIRVFMSSGEIIVSTALLSTASGGSTQFSAGSDSTNRHALTVKMIENTITALIDGEIVYTRENLVRNAIEISAPRSNAGYVYKISITDDTTGEIVWQAAYSDLYDTSNPWPSPVPRNFAEEPEAWTDATTAANGLGEDNWAFEIKLNLKSQITGAVFNNLAGSPLKLYDDLVSSGEASFFLRNYVDTAAWTGRHSIRLEVADGNASLYLDSEFKAAKATGLTSVQFEQASTTSADVEIEAVEFVNLTTGRTVWSYPSEAERVRLITKTNIRTDRGYFEQADTTVNSYVNTALDLRGRVSSYTVFIDFYPAVFPESNNAECHQELAGQGGALIGFGFPPICSVGYYKTVDQTYRLQFAQQSGSLRRTVNVTLAAALSGRCRIVGVVDVQSSSTTLTLYLDGEQIGTSTYSGIPDGTAASIARCFSVAGVKEYGGWINYTGKVYSCLLFDRALSAAEIAALTPKQA